MRQRLIGIWIVLLLILCPLLAVAQIPSFLLKAQDEEMDAGDSGSFSILMANALPLGAFSFGLEHDQWIEVLAIEQGSAVEAIHGGLGPDFWFAEITDNGATPGTSGLVVLMIASDSAGAIDPIPLGVGHPVADVEIAAPGALPGDLATLNFVETLTPVGSSSNPAPPAVPVVMVAADGSEYSPPISVALISGSVLVETPEVINLFCEVTSVCPCEATLSWTNAYPYDAIEVYENDVLLTTLVDTGSGLPTSLVTLMAPASLGDDEQESEFDLIAISNGVESHSTDCDVECPNFNTPLPVQDLECEKDNDRDVVEVEWDLDDEELYSHVDIYVDGSFYVELDPEIEKLDIPFSPFLDEHLIEVTAYNGCGNATTTQSCTVQLTESYQRGDVTGNGQFGLEDPIYFLYWVYLDYPDVSCFDAADADDDGALSLTDPVYMLLNLFGQGPPLLPPSSDCGLDPTPDGIDCESSLLCP